MEDNLIFELDNLRYRSHSHNITIEQITRHLDFVPKLRPKKAQLIPSPMRLNKKHTKKQQKAKISYDKSIFLEEEYIKLAKLDMYDKLYLHSYYSFQEDEEIESDSTGEHYPNKYFKNELLHFKEFNVKTENVFPKFDIVCPFSKSRLSKIITKSYVDEDVFEFLETKRNNSIQNIIHNSLVSPIERKSSSILSFLEKRKYSDCEVLKL